jgi:16S rRNA processing protein RimM
MAAVTVGRVLAAHGVAGGCRCAYHTDYPERLSERESYILRDPISCEMYTLTASSVRLLSDSFLITFLEIPQREQMTRLRGWLLEISAARVPQDISESEFYFYQLQGLDVMKADGQSLGIVINIVRGVNQEVLEVGLPGAETRLIPFASIAIAKVDLEKRQIILQQDFEL